MGFLMLLAVWVDLRGQALSLNVLSALILAGPQSAPLLCFILQPCRLQTRCTVPSKSASHPSCPTSSRTSPRQPSERSPRTCCCGLQRKPQCLSAVIQAEGTCDLSFLWSWSLKQHHKQCLRAASLYKEDGPFQLGISHLGADFLTKRNTFKGEDDI